jgi:hypothetical protein
MSLQFEFFSTKNIFQTNLWRLCLTGDTGNILSSSGVGGYLSSVLTTGDMVLYFNPEKKIEDKE